MKIAENNILKSFLLASSVTVAGCHDSPKIPQNPTGIALFKCTDAHQTRQAFENLKAVDVSSATPSAYSLEVTFNNGKITQIATTQDNSVNTPHSIVNFGQWRWLDETNPASLNKNGDIEFAYAGITPNRLQGIFKKETIIKLSSEGGQDYTLAGTSTFSYSKNGQQHFDKITETSRCSLNRFDTEGLILIK